MTKLKALGTACLVAALAATSPALAGGFGGRAIGGMGAPHAMGGFPATNARFAGGFHGGGFRHGGFGPGIAAGVVAGAALGAATAGYGYYDGYGYDGAYDDGYAVTGGYSCQPGTYFIGEDGRRYLCQ